MKFFSRYNIIFLKKNFQIVYSIILIILIPAGLIINSVVFIKNTQKVIDVELQRKVMLANQIVGPSVPDLLSKQDILQSNVEKLAKSNEEIKSLDIMIPEGDDFKIVASLDKTYIGKISKYLNNKIAWNTEEAVAFQTTSPALSTEDQKSLSDQRFWVVVNVARNQEGQKVALVSMKVSSKIIDDLAQDNLIKSVIILTVTIVIIILLLASNTRLFHYAILFRKLKEVDEMKDEFISMASHELRAPITGIRGYLSMILDKSFGEIPKEAEEKLQMVFEESNRLHDLVEDLLEVSRIQQGRIKFNLQPLAVNLIIESMVKTFEQQAKEKNLKIITEIKTDLPKIYADKSRLEQILVNLVSNSIKYTMKGNVTASAELVSGKEETVKIKISDTGIGMSAKDRERLFEKFYRIKNEKTDKIIGTGLGLWITRELVRLMKGEIYVDSMENVGTQVTILFPVYKEKKK